MILCDLCGQQKECSSKDIEGKVYDICEDCWKLLTEKLTGKGRAKKKERPAVFLPPLTQKTVINYQRAKYSRSGPNQRAKARSKSTPPPKKSLSGSDCPASTRTVPSAAASFGPWPRITSPSIATCWNPIRRCSRSRSTTVSSETSRKACPIGGTAVPAAGSCISVRMGWALLLPAARPPGNSIGALYPRRPRA